jgi:hypothetical protein
VARATERRDDYKRLAGGEDDAPDAPIQEHSPSNSKLTGATSGCPSAERRGLGERLRYEMGSLIGGERHGGVSSGASD